MAAKKSELEILFPEQTLATAAGEIVISPFRLQAFPQVIRLFKKYFVADGEISLSFADILDLLSGDESAQDLTLVISLATNKDVEFLLGLGGEDYFNVLEKFWEVNSDFFARKVWPLVLKVSGGLGLGVRLPSDSSATGTDSATSATTPPTS